ncbi:MAG: DUF4097 family beta strand repeat protein [Candidatus Zixiibacteriota bacterium]|nr:MAG: DUF4097 family beta strand repeat protein [candidate division Zixibacteria bacterium]
MKRICHLLLILILSATAAEADSYRFEYMKALETPGDASLAISNTSGNITVMSSEADSITIEAVKHITAADQQEAEELGEYIDIDVRKSGDRIIVSTQYRTPPNRRQSFWEKLLGKNSDAFGSVDYSITVPQACEVQIRNSSGDVIVSGLSAELYIVGSSGAFRVENIRAPVSVETISCNVALSGVEGDIDISSTSSNITLASITGMIDVRSTSGRTIGSYIDGPLKISKTSGDIEIEHLSGDLRVKSTSGSVDVSQEAGAIDILTQSGNVAIRTELSSDLGYFVETVSGSIHFRVPESSSGSVNLETISGDINTELPVTIRSFSKSRLVGDFGGHGPKILLATSSGDITLGQY